MYVALLVLGLFVLYSPFSFHCFLFTQVLFNSIAVMLAALVACCNTSLSLVEVKAMPAHAVTAVRMVSSIVSVYPQLDV